MEKFKKMFLLKKREKQIVIHDYISQLITKKCKVTH